jgi:asparaginyl-tRNA synthetase
MATSTEATTEQLEACSIQEPTVYTSEKNGSDETGDGSEEKPFKTPLQAYRQHGDNVIVYIDSKDETKGKWELLSKAQAKKIKTRYEEEKRKEKAADERE